MEIKYIMWHIIEKGEIGENWGKMGGNGKDWGGKIGLDQENGERWGQMGIDGGGKMGLDLKSWGKCELT